MKKHVAFFMGSIARGAGTERITTSLANKLSLSGYPVSIISLYKGEKNFFPLEKGIKLYSLSIPEKNAPIHFFKISRRLSKIVKCKKIDILINVDVILALFSLPLKLWIPDLKIISWEHFNYKTSLGVRRRDWARNLSKRYADAIVTLTLQDKNFYCENLTRKIQVINIPNFLNSENVGHADIDKKNVVAIGRLTYQKGFDILLNIWAEARSKMKDRKWKLYIVGDGEDKDKLLQQAEKLNILDSVCFVGAKKDVSTYYLNSSIYLMTSRFEGLPMVLIEALWHGLPIISFDCVTGPADIVDDGQNGYLIPQNDNTQFVEKLIELTSDFERRSKMQLDALEKAKQFKSARIINEWKNLIDNI